MDRLLKIRVSPSPFFYLFLHLIFPSSTRGKAIDRVSLPPPQYGAASFSNSKPARSSSFHSSAPSSGRYDAASTAPPANFASDSHVLRNFLLLSAELHIFSFCFIIFFGFNGYSTNVANMWLKGVNYCDIGCITNLIILFDMPSTALSYLPYQCKGYGLWLWTSGM